MSSETTRTVPSRDPAVASQGAAALSQPGVPLEQGITLGDRLAGVPCPACREPLQLGQIEDSQIAGCPQCHGILLQNRLFADVLARRRANYREADQIPEPLNSAELHVRRNCPACDLPFETHPYGGSGNAVIDACIRCHLVWVDKGELTALIRAAGPRR